MSKYDTPDFSAKEYWAMIIAEMEDEGRLDEFKRASQYYDNMKHVNDDFMDEEDEEE